MTVERHGSGGPLEPVVGYSRVVRAGEMVFVSGCTALTEDGVVGFPGDVYGQAAQALRNVQAALALVGARIEHVVRTRIYVTEIERWEEAARAHGEVFRAIRPATTMLGVASLLDPRMLVEIEADAYLPAGNPR